MPMLYHGCCDPMLKALPPGTQLTDSRDYAEYAGRRMARSAGQAQYYVHEIEADHHEVSYVGRGPRANANFYRLKVDAPVKRTERRNL